jgi:hypothetical protein
MTLDAPDFFPKRERRFPTRRIRNILRHCERSEAIHTGAPDCFTLRDDVRDKLNGALFFLTFNCFYSTENIIFAGKYSH